MSLTVILPVLNEEALIGMRLAELDAMYGVDEIIVVDGGSNDRTVEIATAAGARVVSSAKGRAKQMNAGAREATGDVLLFLHADCALPTDAAGWIEKTLARRGVVAGAFRTWTVAENGRAAPWLHLADLRSRYTRLPYGDQGIFLRKEVFWRVGGFPEIDLMEDLELSMRLRKLGRIWTVPARVRVSGRRFLAHPIRDTFFVNVFPTLYRAGVPHWVLRRLYRDTR